MANFIGDVCMVSHKYKKDGEDKNAYAKIGAAFQNDDGKISIKLFAAPLTGGEDGVWLNVFPPKNDRPSF